MGKKLQITLSEDRVILMVCIGIATLFWFFVKMSQTYQTSRTVNALYTLEPDQAFLILPPAEIKAYFSGTGWDLFYSYLTNPNPVIQLDAGDYPSNMVEPTLLKAKIKKVYNDRIEILDTEPRYILLEYQKAAEKKVPVRFVGEVTFANGYNLRSPIEIEPDSVRIRGPYSLIEAINYWETAPCPALNLKTTTELECALKVPETGEIHRFPPKVKVVIPVEAFTQKTLIVPITIKNAKDSVRLSFDHVKVDFVVGMSRFKTLTRSDFEFAVDFENVETYQDNNTLPITPVRIPEGISGLNFVPKSVEFFIVQPPRDTLPASQ
ncbi:MAG: hypothetical protein D6714_19920 [Bacteroidetes bacterium]|nr:MAG: hypothetical protein D6714_19920 [Bacteroidota bacterium]